jgi:glycosyltransferase involved in cell wall biosynthesis
VNVIIAGTISNVSRTIEKELKRVSGALSQYGVVEIILVESDSTDNTVDIVSSLASQFTNINLISLGDLKQQLPDRISRIRYCRQEYVERIRKIMEIRSIDYVVVVDLDGMNKLISSSGIASCFVRSDWSGVLANQIGGYYDLLALRHESWCPGDILQELHKLQSQLQPFEFSRFNFYRRLIRRLEYDRIRRDAIYSRMIKLPRTSPWIEVDSGFGGFAIYRARVFESFDYSLQHDDVEGSSEHVSLSKQIRKSGGHIFVNPELINNRWNTYNINRIFLVRQLRELYWNLRSRLRLTGT